MRLMLLGEINPDLSARVVGFRAPQLQAARQQPNSLKMLTPPDRFKESIWRKGLRHLCFAKVA